MVRFAYRLIAIAAFFPVLPVYSQTAAPSAIDSAFVEFWNADSPSEAALSIEGILKTGVTFDEALRRLKAGRSYAAQETGVVFLSNRTRDDVEHNYALNIPVSYDPARRYQVRIQLHGGVSGSSDNQPRGGGRVGLVGAEQIYVLPYAWDTEPWWSDDQVLNINFILDTLKRSYNVDENRVVLSGVSDGGTGTYFLAMRDTTPFASFLPLNGSLMVVSRSDIDDGRIFPGNLRNKPLFVVNGGEDPLYPTARIEPYLKHLMAGGVSIDYHPQPAAGHDTSWWPNVVDTYEQFVTDHPRDPDPDKLTWEAADLTYNRAHWLVIDEVSEAAVIQPAAAPPDLNRNGPRPQLFHRPQLTGRVDLVRTGNSVDAVTTGVSGFTLLLSPDRFDLTKPVKVVANGREVFNGRVTPSAEALLKWAARDNDRTMLYAAELKIRLPR